MQRNQMIVALVSVLGSAAIFVAAMSVNFYFGIRQRTAAPLSSQVLRRYQRWANGFGFGALLLFVAVVIVLFSFQNGARPSHKNDPTHAIDVPVNSYVLLLFSITTGVLSAALSIRYFRRLLKRVRGGAPFASQLGDIVRACLPAAPLFIASFAFMLWLGRITGVGLGALLDGPSRWGFPGLLAWLALVGATGDRLARRFAGPP